MSEREPLAIVRRMARSKPASCAASCIDDDNDVCARNSSAVINAHDEALTLWFECAAIASRHSSTDTHGSSASSCRTRSSSSSVCSRDRVRSCSPQYHCSSLRSTSTSVAGCSYAGVE